MTKSKEKKSFRKNWLPLIYFVTIILAARWTLVEPYVVPTGSMEPTLKTGDRLYALKCAYDIRFPFTNLIMLRTGSVKRGDVFLFAYPQDARITFVKRAVGLPGDRIKLVDGDLYINGEKLPKSLFEKRDLLYDIDDAANKSLSVEDMTGVKHWVIRDHSQDSMASSLYEDRHHLRQFGEITVPQGHYFAVGDNRDHSSDSRFWGFVPEANLKGKALFIWFSAWDRANTEVPRTPPSLISQLATFVIDFFVFIFHLFTGDAYFRPERIGTLIQ